MAWGVLILTILFAALVGSGLATLTYYYKLVWDLNLVLACAVFVLLGFGLLAWRAASWRHRPAHKPVELVVEMMLISLPTASLVLLINKLYLWSALCLILSIGAFRCFGYLQDVRQKAKGASIFLQFNIEEMIKTSLIKRRFVFPLAMWLAYVVTRLTINQ